MNKNTLIIGVIVVLILLGGGIFLLSSSPKSETTETPQVLEETNELELQVEASSNLEATGDAMPKASPTDVMVKGETKTFNVEGSPFKFTVTEMKVKKGDTVKVTFTNKEGMHDWVIDEFKAKTAQLVAGKSETIQFVADKAGTFEYYCSVGNHRAQGMKGKLIVE